MTNQITSSLLAIAKTVGAFANRAYPKTLRKTYLLYSLALVLGVIAMAYWVVSSKSAHNEGVWAYGYEPFVWVLSVAMVLQVADIFAMIVLSIGGFVAVPAIVASVVANERKTGTMDQLRATPTQAIGLLFGFVLGVPARLYLLLSGLLALHLFVGAIGVVSLSTVLLTTLILLVGSIATALVGAALTIAPEKGKGGSSTAPVVSAVLALVCIVMANDGIAWAFIHPAGAINAAYLTDSALWSHWLLDPWELDSILHHPGNLLQAPILALAFAASGGAMLVLAAARRIANPDQPLLSPTAALGLFAIACFALIFPFESHEWVHAEVMVVCGLALLPVMALLLIGTQTSARVWALTLRQSGRVSARWALAFGMVGIAAGAMLIKTLTVSDVDYQYAEYAQMSINWFSLGWLAATALSLPIFNHFAAGRYQQTSHRMGYWGVICAHLLFQMFCIGYSHTKTGGPIAAGVLLAVALPGIVLWRTYALRLRTVQPASAT